MIQQMPFIGRKDELKQIEEFIEQSDSRQVLCIHGLGGIGKTRLLEEVRKQYHKNEKINLVISDIIDFDDRTLQLAENVQQKIARQLSERIFEQYLSGLSDWRKMEAAGVSQETLSQQRERFHQIFIDNFNEVSSNQRVILLFDTTEKLQEEVWDYLNHFILASKNVLFLLAGREAEDLWMKLQVQLGDQVQLVKLTPFEPEFGQQYLEQKQRLLHLNIDPNLIEKLILLASGKPILLDLAVEWLSRELPSDWMIQSSLEELQALSEEEMVKRKEDFEIHLVRHIQQMRDQMDRLTLMMSRVYPLTAEMIPKLLRLSEQEAKTLFQEAKTYVFVKSLPDGRISLHDEMRRMVNRYVWPQVDPQERRRRRDSKIAAQLFEQEDRRLKEKLQESAQPDLGSLFEYEALVRYREVVNEQWIEHALYSDPASGFQVWERIVTERRIAKEFRFSKTLVELALKPLYFDQLDPDQQFDIKMLDVRLSSDIGEVDEAEQKLHELLSKNKGQKYREASIYNALGLVEEKLGKLDKALEHQLNCLEIVEKINQASIPAVANRVGYVYRVLGELDKAEEYYKIALNVSVNVKNLERKSLYLSASILNNLAYVYGLQRKNSEMELYCRQAISTWKKAGATKEMGRAESTRAIFKRDSGDYAKAIELFERAISRYQEPDDNEQLCRTYFHLGWTQWYESEIEDESEIEITSVNWDFDLLKKSKESMDKSLTLSRDYKLERLLPKILHQTASIYWCMGHMEEDMKEKESLIERARALNKESYEESEEKGDIRYIIDSLLGEVEWDYEIGEYDKIDNGYYRQILNGYEEYRSKYPLYFGRMARIEADLNFKRKDYELAFPKYSEGLALINQHGGFSRYTIEREILRLENKMNRYMTSEQITKWVEYLRDQWSQMQNQDTDFLIAWCEGELLRAKLRLIG